LKDRISNSLNDLSFNCLTIEASWQIRLHETKPLSTFSCRNGTNTYFVVELAATAACDKFTEQFPGVLLRLFWHLQRPWLSFRGVQMGFYSISSWHFWRNLTVTMTHVYCTCTCSAPSELYAKSFISGRIYIYLEGEDCDNMF